MGAGRPMRAGARMLYQRLAPASSSMTAGAPEQRTRSGVIDRSKCVNACSTWLKGCGSIAAARKLPRAEAAAHEGARRGGGAKLRQAPQPSPHAALGPAFQQYAAVILQRHHHE